MEAQRSRDFASDLAKDAVMSKVPQDALRVEAASEGIQEASRLTTALMVPVGRYLGACNERKYCGNVYEVTAPL